MMESPHTSLNVVDKARSIERFASHVSSGKARFFDQAGIDFVLGKRTGPYLWDISGEKRLIDCHCNGGVFNLGHRNPQLIQALVEALQELDIGNHHLISDQRGKLAERLAELAPGNLPFTVFSAGGGEAIDLAIKIARAYTGRSKIISAIGGYHGHTGLALAAGDEKYRAPFGPLSPGFVQAPFGNVEALTSILDSGTAALLLETIPATSGIHIPPPDYFYVIRQLCDRLGVLLILDEVQSGLGRTGRMWACEHFGVAPDILVSGKGLSGGIYPIAATCFSERLESIFHADPFIHVSTFGGSELGCQVALKVLEITANPEFLDHIRQSADCFKKAFIDMKARHSNVLEGLRQLGMMMGIELTSPKLGPAFTQLAYQYGLLAIYANNNPRVVQLLPPLNIDWELCLEIVERVDRTLTRLGQLAN